MTPSSRSSRAPFGRGGYDVTNHQVARPASRNAGNNSSAPPQGTQTTPPQEQKQPKGQQEQQQPPPEGDKSCDGRGNDSVPGASKGQ